jgi:hypothetical protein
MSQPWLKFYPRDWRGDQALRACSVTARGLWIEMLCVMHEASPYGHLILGGRAVSDDILARVAGLGVEECSAMVAELESAGVLSRTRKGVIYSRRMVKDNSRAEKGRKAVNRRWKQQPEKQEKNDTANRLPDSDPITQKPEARVSEDKSSGDKPPDPLKDLIDLGVSLLVGADHTEKQARSLVGKWRKDHGDEKVLSVLLTCKTKAIANPVEWVTKSLSGSSGYVSASGFQYRGSEDDVLRQAERRADWDTYWKIKKNKKVAA